MKFIAVFTIVCIVAVLARPEPPVNKRRLPATLRTEQRDLKGQYNLKYHTAEGTKVNEQGTLVPNAKGDDVVLIKSGNIEHLGDDGKVYKLEWVADELGYRVVGDHIPVV